MNERGLVEAFLHGDERAFSALYDRHTPALYQFALRLVGGGEPDAEDVVQEAWLRAADRLPGFEWRSTFRTWLMGFALNCARELVRRHPARIDPDVAPDDRPAPIGATPGDTIDLENAIIGLPVEFRWVLVLHDLEGFTHAEIAARLAIDEGTSKSRLFRARRRVREALRGERP